MKHWLASFLLFSVFSLHANVVERYYYTPAGEASFTSDTPLELIAATSNQMIGMIDPIHRTFAFKIPVASFNGFNSGLQRSQFNEKFMESDKYPEATFTGKLPFDFSELKKGMQALKVFGILKMHGVQKERTIPVYLFMANQLMVIHTKFSVSLEDHNIQVPKILYKKVASEITVEAKALMKIKFGAIDPSLASSN